MKLEHEGSKPQENPSTRTGKFHDYSELRASEETYRSLVTNLNDIVYTVNAEGRITYISHQVESITGYKPSELLGRPFADFIHPEDLSGVLGSWQERQEGKAEPAECRVAVKNGQHLFARASARPQFQAGRFAGVAGIITDMTEQHEVESALRASEEKYRSLVTDLNDVVCRVDARGDITYISHQVESISGYKPSELLGGPFLRLVHPEDLAGALEIWQGCQKGELGTTECRVLVKNGQYRFARQSFRPQFEDGQFVGATAVISDVTEQHEAESALRESEQKYRVLFEQSIDAVGLTTPEGRIAEANASWFRLFGYSPGDLEWLNARDLYAEPEDRDIFLRIMAEKGALADDEVRHKKKDGTVMDCLRSVSVLCAANGSVLGYQTVFRDITERKRMETELLQSEENLRFLTDNVVDIVWTADLNFHTTYVSPSIEKVLGFSPEERKRQRLDEMATPDSVRRIVEALRQELEQDARGDRDPEKSVTLEVEYYRKDGSTVWMENLVKPTRGPSGTVEGLLAVARDITDRRRAEAALRESEEEFRALFELSRDAIALVRPDGTFIDVNQAWLDLFGFSREELPSITAYTVHESPAERDAALLKGLRETGGITDAEFRFRKKDGTVMDCLCNVVARRDETGAIVSIQTSTRDVTQARRARRELQESRDNLNELHAYLVNGREAERAAIAGELHDQTSQALNALRLDLSDMRRRAARGESIDPAPLDRMMELVDNTSEDVRRLSSDLRPGVLDDLGLSAAIEWNVQEFASWTGLRTSLHLSADDSTVAADCATAVFRVLRELLANVARHARASAVSVSLLNPGDRLVLTVTDDGRGITDRQLASRKSLGIISIRERVNLFGGDVVIRGEPGKGTTAEVTIPIQSRLPE